MKTRTLISAAVSAAAAMTAVTATTLPVAAQQTTRDPWIWPFRSDSIWNTPIGQGATYVAADINNGWNTSIDHEWFVKTTATDPFRTLYFPGPNTDRDAGTTVSWLGSIRLPDSFVVPDSYPGYTPNDCSTILQPDGHRIYQLQPTTRPTIGGPVWGYPQTDWGQYPSEGDLYGQGERGTHYGSGLSSIGGSIRKGELLSAGNPRHALKVNLWGKYHYSSQSPGYRWPARNADGYWNSGGNAYGGTNPELRPGSLLAIPRTWTEANLDGGALESEVGRKLFWTLKHFGAYVVDDSAWYTNAICAEKGVDEELLAQYGSRLTGPQSGSGSTPISRDMGRLFRALHVISNNTSTTKGGPGARLTRFAPPAMTQFATNQGFEAQQFWAQSPTGWAESGATGASYTESNSSTYSGSYHLAHWANAAYQVYTSQTRTGLANGTYNLRAVAKRGGLGTFNVCQLEASGFGGTTRTAAVPAGAGPDHNGGWHVVEIRGISVTNGQITFGFRTDAGANCWANFDNVEIWRE